MSVSYLSVVAGVIYYSPLWLVVEQPHVATREEIVHFAKDEAGMKLQDTAQNLESHYQMILAIYASVYFDLAFVDGTHLNLLKII